MTLFRRVAVVVGHDPAEDAAVPFGFDLAARLGAEPIVLHAIPSARLDAARATAPLSDVRALREAERAARERVRRALGRDVPELEAIVTLGTPLEALAQLSGDASCALLVVGHAGRTDEHLALLRASPVPVLVVPNARGGSAPRLSRQQPIALSPLVGRGELGARAHAAACALAHELNARVHVERRARRGEQPTSPHVDVVVVEAPRSQRLLRFLDERALERSLARLGLPTVVVPRPA